MAVIEDRIQYRVTKRLARGFARSLRAAERRLRAGWWSPNARLFLLAERDAFASQLADLREQLAEHRRLRRRSRPRPFFRLMRWFLGRDLCERCDGTRGEPGNENIIEGLWTCDDCHVRWEALQSGAVP